MKKIISLWAWFLCFLVWALTSGCITLPTSGTLFPKDFARAEIPAPQVPDADEGWCEKAKPIAPGHEVECIGILTPPHKLAHLMTEAEILEQTRNVIQLSYGGRQSDREYAASILAAREEQLLLAKERQPRLFGIGIGVGAGSAVAVITAILLATR
jgi:uncharacterized protein YceK